MPIYNMIETRRYGIAVITKRGRFHAAIGNVYTRLYSAWDLSSSFACRFCTNSSTVALIQNLYLAPVNIFW